MRRIDKLKARKKEIELQIDVEIIKPHLKKIGYDFEKKSKNDFVKYTIARKGDMRYLAFSINKDVGEFTTEYSSTCGQIIYDVNGNVLLECVPDTPCYYDDIYRSSEDNNQYKEIDPANVFIDDETVLLGDDNEKLFRHCSAYKVYKLRDGKYEYKNETFGIDSIVKTSNGDVFLQTRIRLYDVKKNDFMNTPVFSKVYGAETPLKNSLDVSKLESRYIDEETKERIVDIVNNNNLLLGYTRVENGNYIGEDDDEADVIVLFNTSGEIVSDLFVKTETKFYTLDVTNDTYAETIEIVRKNLVDDIRKRIALEERRKNRKLKLMDKAEHDMLNALSADFSVSKPGVQKTIKPNK